MTKGINCVVWNVQGTTATKNVSSQITDSIKYILNNEKTDFILPMPDSPICNTEAQLGRECQYVENDIKTFQGAFVGGINVISTDPKEAVQEMMRVKKFYGKLDGRAALHGVLTLDAEESGISNGPELMKVCEEVLKELFPSHQAIFAVHTNTDNLHVHFIINSVGLDGRKIHQPKEYINKIVHPAVNQCAMKHGFTPNIKWTKNNTNISSYAELKMQMREEIDKAIENASSFNEFLQKLREAELIVNVGKHISIRTEDLDKAVRTYQLGSNYTKDAIVERIATRKNALNHFSISDLSIPNEEKVLFVPSSVKMKKYKDMDSDEKKYAVSLLKLGKNPWQMSRQINWQLNETSNQVNSVYRVTELVKHYSTDGTVQNALDNILEAKREISEEKKQIRTDQKKNKVIIDIYKEMRQIETRAYLFEHEKVAEYENDYNHYKELTRRLRKGYNKEFTEVAAYVESCDEQTLYAHAQLHELSSEYREIRKYAKEHGNILHAKDSLLEVIGLDAAKKEDRKDIHTSEVFFITSKTSDVMLRVIKGVKVNSYGNLTHKFDIAVMNRYGDVVDTLTDGSGEKRFREQIKAWESTYGLKECEKYYSTNLAREYLKAKQPNTVNPEPEKMRTIRKEKVTGGEKRLYSFTQAINLHSVKEKEGTHVIVNSEYPTYMALVLSNENSINVQVVDGAGKIQETVEFPGMKNRSYNGYSAIIALQKKYGFSDRIISFDRIEIAKKYMENSTNKERDSSIFR